MILFWGKGYEAFADCLKEYSGDDDSFGGIHVEGGVKGFRVALASHRAELRLVVLAPPTTDDLAALLTLIPLLAGIPVILLLSSTDRETTTLAHRFHPRFVSSADGAWEDAASVAANILKTKKEARVNQSNGGDSAERRRPR